MRKVWQIIAILLAVSHYSCFGLEVVEQLLCWEMHSKTDRTIQLVLVGKCINDNAITFHPYRAVTKDSIGAISEHEILSLRQFQKNDTALYNAIKRNELIDYAYIQELDLGNLGNWLGDTFIVNYPLNLNLCIIDNIIFPNNPQLGTIGVKKYVSFNKKVILNHCNYNISGINTLFKDSVAIYSPLCKFNQLLGQYWINTRFEKHIAIYYDYPSDFNRFLCCGLNYDQNIVGENQFSRCFFDATELYIGKSCIKINFDGCTFYKSTIIDKYDSTQAVQFRNCSYNNKTSFISFDKNLSLKDCVFRDTLDLYDFRALNNGPGFSNSIITPKTAVLLNPNTFDLTALNFNILELRNADFPFVLKHADKDFVILPMTSSKASIDLGNDAAINYNNYDSLDDATYFKLQNFYLVFQNYIRGLNNTESETVNYLQKKFQHRALEYEILYHKERSKQSFADLLSFLWLSFLEQVVGNGFNGERNFFITALSIVLAFSMVYYWKFQIDIIEYIDEKEYRPKYHKGSFKHNYIKNIVKSIWFSVVVFLNPRLPKKYFYFKNGLFLLIFLEWFIGLALIILFLIYVAVNYPFVKSLFGI